MRLNILLEKLSLHRSEGNVIANVPLRKLDFKLNPNFIRINWDTLADSCEVKVLSWTFFFFFRILLKTSLRLFILFSVEFDLFPLQINPFDYPISFVILEPDNSDHVNLMAFVDVGGVNPEVGFLNSVSEYKVHLFDIPVVFYN